MAKTNSVWGIDIGQCALKAMRCTRQGDQIVVDAVDYIEYPKILSQPDEADPKQLVKDALDLFISRNELKGDRIAISVPGQSGLARFFKPPPVDAKKIPDIVRFEARQQIPFALEDVIWDYQLLAGQEVDGFAVDAEVGLFAMKRDQVFRSLAPFTAAGLELDIVQLAPLSIFNFVTYDLLGEREVEYDPDNPPPSVVVLALGTETTDLVVTNGFRVWQRSIPLGGNHFTKQLTKEMKLTFAKAEHFKRNARQAEDPKRVFQAMRPVFNDLVTEVQRSVSYFQNIDRKAKIEGVVILGNAVKLPGLQQYLAKNLGYDVIPFDEFRRLEEEAVRSSPAYQENKLAYGVCYGLCLQGLQESKLKTNLIPRELLVERLIRAKKPWAVASVSALMLACAFNFFFHYSVWYRVNETREVQGVAWTQAESAVDTVQSLSQGYERTDKEKLDQKNLLERIGNEVVGNADRRILWLELVSAINRGLPRTPGIEPGMVPDPKIFPFPQRQELYIEKIETEYFRDLTDWYTENAQARYEEGHRVLYGDDAGNEDSAGEGEGGALEPPTGEGWVVELQGYHFFNEIPERSGPAHVYNTLIRYLEEGVVTLPNPKADGEVIQFTMRELGVGHPLLAQERPINQNFRVPNPNFSAAGGYGAMAAGGMPGGMPGGMDMGMTPGGGMDMGMGMMPGGGMDMGMGMTPGGGMPGGRRGGMGQRPQDGSAEGSDAESKEDEEPQHFVAPRYDFTVQFSWQPTLLSERLLAREEAERQRAEEEGQGDDQEGDFPDDEEIQELDDQGRVAANPN
jgi:type IV pilus assembly protein PilM